MVMADIAEMRIRIHTKVANCQRLEHESIGIERPRLVRRKICIYDGRIRAINIL